MAAPRVKVWIVALVVAVAAVLAGVMAWTAATAPLNELRTTAEFEQRRQTGLEGQVASLTAEVTSATAAAEKAWAEAKTAKSSVVATSSGPPSTTTTTGSKKSFTTLAHIKKMTGPYNETFTVYLDTFQILTGAKATAYAKAHGTKVPSNGILYVDTDHKLTSYPLSDMATITAYTGGVEVMTPLPVAPGKLQQWVSDPTVIPDASSDQWQVTVVGGVITVIKMIAVAG